MTRVKASRQPRMIVVQHRPVFNWFMRIIALVAFVVGWGVAYYVGYQTGAATETSLRAEIEALSDAYSLLGLEHQTSMQTLTNIHTGALIDKQANETVRQEIMELKKQLQQAEEKNRFYRSIMRPDKGVSGIEVGDWSLTHDQTSGRYNFEVVVKQLANHNNTIKGTMTIEIEGQTDNNGLTLNYAKLNPEAEPLKLGFRYFQVLKGSFELPADFTPTEAVVTLKTNDKKQDLITKRFAWQNH